MKKVYIASPYSKGDKQMNVSLALEAAQSLISAGFAPFFPLWMHYLTTPPGRAKCFELDNIWLDFCDYVLRLPGESKGTDDEVERALLNGKSVFGSIDALVEYDKYGLEDDE
jgi:hypothetical protein